MSSFPFLIQGRFKLLLLLLVTICLFSSMTACGQRAKQDDGEKLLDPNQPTTISIWHYYNGPINEAFDNKVSLFNDTLGQDLGIIVENQSYGDVTQLEQAVIKAASQAIGSAAMPDIFASYPDNALKVAAITDLVPLSDYLTESELGEYRQEFLEEGRFLPDGKPYIMPIAKSTENLFVNKTSWDEFASRYGYEDQDLTSWETLAQIAADYYQDTGKAFLGVESMANYAILFFRQLGVEVLATDEAGNPAFNFDRDRARKLWDLLYTPHIKGHYAKYGRYSSDDAKTGDIVAFTSSTAGAGYFPLEITLNGQSYQVESLVVAYPYLDEAFVVQQGAGMCIVRSNSQREYAAAAFLNWFNQLDNNIDFAVGSGYLPVKAAAYKNNLLLDSFREDGQAHPTIRQSLVTTINMFENYQLYGNKPYPGSYELRGLLSSIQGKIDDDLDVLAEFDRGDPAYQQLIQELISDQAFDRWYQDMINKSRKIIEETK